MQTQTERGYPAPGRRRVLGRLRTCRAKGLTQEPSTRRPVSAGDRLAAAQPGVRTGAGYTRKGDLSEHHPNRAARQAEARAALGPGDRPGSLPGRYDVLGLLRG